MAENTMEKTNGIGADKMTKTFERAQSSLQIK